MTLSYYAAGPAAYQIRWVTEPMPCRQCGQELQGLTEEQRCPQCGLPVGRTLQPGVLRFAPPAWLERVRSGLLLNFWATIIGIGIALVVSVAIAIWGFRQAQSGGSSTNLLQLLTESRLIAIGASAAALLFNAVLTYGLWLYTSPEPEPGASPHTRKLGPPTRGLAVTALALSTVTVVLIQSELLPDSDIHTGLETLLNLLNGAAFILMLLYLAELCAQAPDPKLASRARTTGWVGGLGMMGQAVMGILMWFFGAMPTATTTGRPPGPTAALGCVSGIIGLVLLGCYIIYLVTLWQLARHMRLAHAHADRLLHQPQQPAGAVPPDAMSPTTMPPGSVPPGSPPQPWPGSPG